MIELNSTAAPSLDAATAPFLGQWHRLVSTTNWEKGRIIFQWREALSATAALAAAYSDEAWSLRVGGVTAQHVGRLRRVHERFAAARDQFPGIFWSHFQAALDWDDAEMWLEGAVQSRWSVAEMRRKRSDTLGAVAASADAAASPAESPDDDFSPELSAASPDPGWTANVAAAADSADDSDEPTDAPPWNADDSTSSGLAADDDDEQPGVTTGVRTAPTVRLAELPDDLAEAFEAFKLAIIRHRLAGWTDVAHSDVLSALEWLRQLTLQESDG